MEKTRIKNTLTMTHFNGLKKNALKSIFEFKLTLPPL
jgi:hypothetical protein